MSKKARRAIQSAQIKVRKLMVKIIAGTNAAVCASATDIANATEIFTNVAHGFVTGDKVQVATSSALPTGLSANTNYWILKLTADTFQVCDTYAHAIAGTNVVTISDDGTGNQTFTQHEKLVGLDSELMTLLAKEKGKYTITIKPAYAFECLSVDLHAQAVAREVDKCPAVISETISGTSNVVIVHISDIDETAALNDGFFNLEITGSDSIDRWS